MRMYITDYGTFLLDRKLRLFEGELDYLGVQTTAYLEASQEEDAENAVKSLYRIYPNLLELDKKIRHYVLDTLYEDVKEWNDEEISEQQFMNRIGIPTIIFFEDGVTEFYYPADNMFDGHVVVVNLDDEDVLTDCRIEG